jgi:hypothetical protein
MKKFLSALLMNPLMSLHAIAQDSSGLVNFKEITAPHYRCGEIKHIVMFHFKPEVNANEKQVVVERFLELEKSALRNGKPYILSIKTGGQNSHEGLSMGFEQAFIVTFKSEGDRNYYVGTPLVNDPQYFDAMHDDFKKFIAPLILADKKGALVFDFRVED